LPAVVFVTAYDAHAVRAFELNAADYLLKPVTPDRLEAALQKVRAQRSARRPSRAELAGLLAGLAPDRPRGASRLIVRELGQIVVVAAREVDWIEGADYYAKLHVGPKVHLLRETLGSLEQRLDPRRFFRVHRSTIVNLERVRIVESALRGDGVAVLSSGARVKVTGHRRDELERRIADLPEPI
jgi:two-component system, LytTR family, response regulator